MKIGMILDYTFPTDSRVENEAVSLIKAGHEVFLFCLTYGNELLEETIKGIKVCRYNTNWLEYKLSALAYSIPLYTFLMSKKIRHFIKSQKVDVLHIHDIRIAEAVFKVNRYTKLPIVLDLHDNMPEIMKLYPHVQKLPGKYLISPKKWKKKEEEFIHKADRIITVSPEFVEEVIQRTGIAKNKIVLVPNSVRSSFFEDAIIERRIIERYKDDFVVLYLGDTNIRRGLQTAIEATKILSEKIKNFKLVIVGKNSTDVILKKQVVDLGIQNNVDFEGWQDVSLFPSYIVASHVCISPLHRNIQHDVAYANKIFQYMSFGKPLLVSNATAQKDLVNRIGAGLVHEEKNAEDFTTKVLRLFNDNEFAGKIGKKGEYFIKNEFSWEHTSKDLITLYDTLKT